MLTLVGNSGFGEIWRVLSGEFPSNAYICQVNQIGDAILIDGGLDPCEIESAFLSLKLRPRAVFCTHAHFDHSGSASFFQDKYKTDIYINKEDGQILRSSNFLLMAMGLKSRVKLPKKIEWVTDGDQITFSKNLVKFFGVPGHTPGSSLIQFGNALFTGDTVYANGVGLSGLPGEDPVKLKESILKNLDCLITNKKYDLYPGHGISINGGNLLEKNLSLLDFLGI